MFYLSSNRTLVNCHRCTFVIKHLTWVLKENFYTTSGNLQVKKDNGDTKEKDNCNSKIIYNCAIKDFRASFRQPEVQSETRKPPIVSLKYFNDDFKAELATLRADKKVKNSINLPYEKHDNVTLEHVCDVSATSNYDDDNQETVDLSFSTLKDKTSRKVRRKWMKDYEKYSEVSVNLDDEDSDSENSVVMENVKYGSADPSIPCSPVPCGGCGAHLHCQDFAIPGFLPKEIFVGRSNDQLQALLCQRCHFMQEYDIALTVSVDPQIYPKLLSQIKGQTALVILVVDMTDFPCSIWPGILDIVGPKRPLFVVGNKIDLLQDWSRDCLKRAQEALIKQLPSDANILHVSLISAKTGYGIESLITSLYNLWQYRGDVYLVGCTNVGKSTLFNALLQSDYCKTKAVDLMQRATISPWPGTTLNLLKFPIMRPQGWRQAMRLYRLRHQKTEDKERLEQGRGLETPQMISRIERTFSHGITDKYNDEYWDDPFAMPKLLTLRRMKPSGSGLDPNDAIFANSKWLYDTPGVITPDQIIDLLTTEELIFTLPKKPLVPRTFQVWPGQTLFLAGLGRIDYIDGPENLKMTVMAASTLPMTLCWLADANDVYEQYLGTEALAVPRGGEHRLQLWPGLQPKPEFTLKGIGWKESCADVVLSSAGWVAVTGKLDTLFRLQAWTPKARGIHVRIPPVLPRAIAVKGGKMNKTQAYALYNDQIKALLR